MACVLADQDHIRLHPQCGACGDTFHTGDRIVSLILQLRNEGNKSLTCVVVSAPDYSPYDPDADPDPVFCGLHPNGCFSCAAAPETATVHVDCFNLYSRLLPASAEDDRLYRLWSAATARCMWPTSLPLFLLPEANVDLLIEHTAALTGWQKLRDLPTEIAIIMADHMRHTHLSRLCLVQELVGTLSREDRGLGKPIPLSSIKEWHRGGELVLTSEPDETPLKVTVDVRGISYIGRRLPYQPPSVTVGHGANLFIELHPRHEQKVTFEYGLCHLTSPPSWERREIWGIHNPPVLDDMSVFIPRRVVLYATVHLQSCFGITFFVCGGRTIAIHNHTMRDPCAETAFRRFHHEDKIEAIWVYLPLAPGDDIQAFGVRPKPFRSNPRRDHPVYLIRTAKQGDFTAGPWSPDKGEDEVFITTPHSVLVCTGQGFPRSYWDECIGLTPRSDLCSDFSPAAPRVARDEEYFDTNTCFASAVLRSVACIWIYRDAGTEHCRGLVVDYQDGSRRALGSCRLGVDPAERCVNVADFRFRSEGKTVWVRAAGSHTEEGWTYFVEGAVLEVWVSQDGMSMSLITD